jgi:hypothetical protein
MGQTAINVELGDGGVLRRNTAGVSYSQAIRFGGEVDASGGTIRQQIGAAKPYRWVLVRLRGGCWAAAAVVHCWLR